MVMVVLLAGCKLIDAKQPGHYLCVRDAGSVETQCPGGWECGYGGFCLDPAAPEAWTCAVDDDCVGGWHCGLDGLCLDPSVPRAFRCATDHDCAGGWHCGVLNLCYDAADAGAVGCRAEVPADCAPSWRCGLNHTCHDTDAGVAYACASDLDCERGWRCGPDAVCLDASSDALRPNATLPAPTSVVVNPVLPVGTPDQVATEGLSPVYYCGTQTQTQTTMVLYGSSLYRLKRYQTWLGAAPVVCPSGTIDAGTRFVSADLHRTQLSFSGGKSIGYSADRTWLVIPDGGIETVSFDEDAGLFVEAPVSSPVPVTGLSLGDVPLRSFVVAFSGSQVAVLPFDGGSWDLAPPLPADAGTILFAAGNMNRILRVSTGPGVSWQLGPPATRYGSMQTSDWQASGTACQWSCLGGTAPNMIVPFDAIGSGTPGLTFYPHLLYCPSLSDGGTGVEIDEFYPSSSCSFGARAPVDTPYGPLQQGVRVQPTYPDFFTGDNLSYGDSLGGLWVGGSGFFRMENLTQVPTVLSGAVDSPLVYVNNDHPPYGSNPYKDAFVGGGTFQLQDAGFVNLTDVAAHAPLLSGIEGRPQWGFWFGYDSTFSVIDTHGEGLLWLSRQTEFLANLPSALSDPILKDNFIAAPRLAAPPPDAGSALVLGWGDTVYVADLSGGPAPLSHLAAPLHPVSTPLAKSSLTALLALKVEPGASYSSNYVIVAGRVFRLRADNPIIWQTFPVLDRASEAIALWSDGARARVGFTDGSAYSLPSGTPLAPALAPNASVALDFKNVCGHSFLLTRSALYQLVSDGSSPLGTWRKVQLSATGELDQPLGKLQSDGQGLLVYRERGVVERLHGLTCLPSE
jgi:hypothetical protein